MSSGGKAEMAFPHHKTIVIQTKLTRRAQEKYGSDRCIISSYLFSLCLCLCLSVPVLALCSSPPPFFSSGSLTELGLAILPVSPNEDPLVSPLLDCMCVTKCSFSEGLKSDLHVCEVSTLLTPIQSF